MDPEKRPRPFSFLLLFPAAITAGAQMLLGVSDVTRASEKTSQAFQKAVERYGTEPLYVYAGWLGSLRILCGLWAMYAIWKLWKGRPGAVRNYGIAQTVQWLYPVVFTGIGTEWLYFQGWPAFAGSFLWGMMVWKSRISGPRS